MKTIDSIIENMRETYDTDTIDEYVEGLPYELMHILLEEIDKLGKMVMSVRSELNALTPPGQYEPYPDLATDIWDMSWYDHPSVKKYEEIYGLIE
ncbi:MAG: hypothetical protein FWG53_00900 [Clostridiales bacterium]|nr:hypothetical protein [Clostridiales bacterium]